MGREPRGRRPAVEGSRIVSQTVKAVIARSKGADVEVVDIVVPDPGPGEAVVKVQSLSLIHI